MNAHYTSKTTILGFAAAAIVALFVGLTMTAGTAHADTMSNHSGSWSGGNMTHNWSGGSNNWGGSNTNWGGNHMSNHGDRDDHRNNFSYRFPFYGLSGYSSIYNNYYPYYGVSGYSNYYYGGYNYFPYSYGNNTLYCRWISNNLLLCYYPWSMGYNGFYL